MSNKARTAADIKLDTEWCNEKDRYYAECGTAQGQRKAVVTTVVMIIMTL